MKSRAGKRQREEKEQEERRCRCVKKVGKSRNTVLFQWFGAPEGGCGASWPDERWKIARRCGAKHISKSKCTKHLGLGALLEVAMSKKCTPLWHEAHFQVKMYKTPQRRTTFGSCDVEKVHAVVARSTFPSQNVQSTPWSDHFWKLRCRKSARRCGEAHFEVNMYKAHHGRTTFGGSDVEKVHAVVARSTFRSQNVKNTRGSDRPLLEVQMSLRVAGARDFAPCQKSKTWVFLSVFKYNHHYTTLHSNTSHYTTTTTTTTPSLHSTTLHFTTLHCTQLHSITLNYTTTLHHTALHSTTLHYITLHYTTFHYSTTLKLQLHNHTPLHNTRTTTTQNYTTLNYTTLNYFKCTHSTTLHYTKLHYTKWHYTTLHYTTLHYTALHYTTLHSTTLHYITLHSTTLQLQLRLHNYTPHSTTLNYTTLHYTTLHYIPLHSTTLHYIR